MLQQLTIEKLPMIADLAAKVFKPDYIDFRPDFFRWQFQRAFELFGDGEDTGSWINVEEDGDVTALWVAQKAPIWVDGRSIVGAWGHEWYSDPERKLGTMELLIRQMRTDGIYCGMGTGIEPMTVKSGLYTFQWLELRRLYGVIDPIRTARAIENRLDCTEQYLKHVSFNPRRQKETAEAVVIGGFDADYDETWRSVRRKLTFGTDRSAAYMNWRYVENPFLDYRWRKFVSEAGPAYFVWRYEEVADRIKVARIVEVVGETDAVRLAMPSLCAIFAADGVDYYDYYGTHAKTIAGLLGGGMLQIVTLDVFDLPRLFSPMEIDYRKTIATIILVDKRLRGPWLYDMGDWMVTKGDGNQDRINP